MTAQKPNLFKMATKELTHDAVYSWFLTWASKEYAESPDEQDQEMHKLGVAFLAMLSGFSIEELSGKTVKVHRQWHKIDIMVEVEGTLVLAIENKTFSSLGAHQQKTYSDWALKQSKDKSIPKTVFCYVKTGSEDERVIKSINDFKPANPENIVYTSISIGINDILEVCNNFATKIHNHAFQMFLEYLNEQKTSLTSLKLSTLRNDYRAFESLLHRIQGSVNERNNTVAKVLCQTYYQYCGIFYGSRAIEKGGLHIEVWLKRNSPDAMIIYSIGNSSKPEQESVIARITSLAALKGLTLNAKKYGKWRILLKAQDAFRTLGDDELDINHLNQVIENLEKIVKEFQLNG